jgi:phosphoribosyl 1,2-cyclic phosphodiesterase
MHIRVLASSSAGNCTVFWNDGRALLVDIGLSQRYISGHLDDLRLSFRTLGGVLITHTHGDHVLPETFKKILDLQIPVLCPAPIAATLQKNFAFARKAAQQGLLRELGGGAGTIAGFDVEAFPVPHDAPGGCYGYVIHSSTLQGTTTAVISTDLGYAPDGLARQFADADAIILESNHDAEMLELSKRPEWLKRRIKEIGHLSNDQSAMLMREILGVSRRLPAAVVLAHISRECNTVERAHGTMQESLHAAGASEIRVIDSYHNGPNELLTLTPRS